MKSLFSLFAFMIYWAILIYPLQARESDLFQPSDQADIGLIGLAVMGQNLVLNMNDHGYTVAVYNRTVSKVDDFLAGPAKGTKVIGTHSLEELVQKLKRPRRIMLMVVAGTPVDDLINLCTPLLEGFLKLKVFALR